MFIQVKHIILVPYLRIEMPASHIALVIRHSIGFPSEDRNTLIGILTRHRGGPTRGHSIEEKAL